MALPPSKHQHCTDEAQKAETVLSAVSYIYIYRYIYTHIHTYIRTWVTMLVQELRTIVPHYLVHEMKNNTLFLDCRDAHSPDYMIFMHNLGCVAQN